MMHKQQQNEENTTHLYPRNKPQNNLEKNQGRSIKISNYFNKTAQDTFNNSVNQKAYNNKTFRMLNHHYTMKIALITRNLRENNTTPNHLQQKKPIESKTLQLVPIFNSR
jgi:hypothetical protein